MPASPQSNSADAASSPGAEHTAEGISPSLPRSSQSSGKLALLTDFVIGQGATQLIQALTGFVIVRYLPAEQFAILTLAFAFQTTASIYTEMGVGPAILPLVGQDTENQTRLARLTSAAFQLRYLYFGIVGVVCLWLFPFTALEKGWEPWLIASLMGSILLTLWASGNVNIYSTPLRIRRELKGIYRAQILPGIARLILVAVLLITGFANAGNLAWIAAFAIVAGGWMVRTRANLQRTGSWDTLRPERREILRITTPLIPGTLFYAFQGQILVFLAAAFSSTSAIAEIGALGRLGILFAMAGAFAGQVIAPWFARQQRSQLRSRYLSIFAAYVSLLVVAVLVAAWFPAPFLWIIGPQYAHLAAALPLAFAGSMLALTNGTIFLLNHSRGWVYWWGEVLIIVLVIATQGVLLFLFGAQSLETLLWITAASQAVSLFVNMGVSLRGYTLLSRGNVIA